MPADRAQLEPERNPRERAGARVAPPESAGTAALTPLVDVVFLLIVFFVLVAQFTRAQRVEMTLPSAPEAAALAGDAQRVIVNIAQRPGGEFGCFVEGASFALDEAGVAALARAIESRLLERGAGAGVVVLRAPANAPVTAVAPALEALRLSGARRAALATRGEHG